RLCFIGQRAGVWTGSEPTLGLDLGGGSLEAAVGDARHLALATSAALGPGRGQPGGAARTPGPRARRRVGGTRPAGPIGPARDAGPPGAPAAGGRRGPGLGGVTARRGAFRGERVGTARR